MKPEKDETTFRETLLRANKTLFEEKLVAKGVDVKQFRAAERKYAETLKEFALRRKDPDPERLIRIRKQQIRRNRSPNNMDIPFPPPRPHGSEWYRELVGSIPRRPDEHFVAPRFCCRYTEFTDNASNIQSELVGDFSGALEEIPPIVSTDGDNVAEASWMICSDAEEDISIAQHLSSVTYNNIEILDQACYCFKPAVSFVGLCWAYGGASSAATVEFDTRTRLLRSDGTVIDETSYQHLNTIEIPMWVMGAPDQDTTYFDVHGGAALSSCIAPVDGSVSVEVQCRVTARYEGILLTAFSVSGGNAGVYYDGLRWGQKQLCRWSVAEIQADVANWYYHS